MKHLYAVFCVLLIACSCAFSQKAPTTVKDKVSYSIGVSLAKNFQMQGVVIDVPMMMRGLKDALGNKPTAMTEKEMEETMMNFQKEMMTKAEMKKKIEGGKNKKDGEAFLAENKTKPGIVTLPSGLQYKVITMGTGAKPTAAQTVKCNYRGTLIDGKEFDSSYKRGEPAEFPLDKVIPGWTEGIQLMPVGSKFQFFIPSNLAYGEQGGGQIIGPNAVLIFEVELLSIK